MLKMFSRITLLLFCFVSLSWSQEPIDKSYLEQYKQLNVEGVRSTGDYKKFSHRVRSGVDVIIQNTGFSGSDYEAKLDLYSKDFLNLMKVQSKQRMSSVIMGGSVDGFGAGYELISKSSLNNFFKLTGMVASQIVEYQIQYSQWGDVISPKNRELLLFETYKENNESSWELKPSKGAPSKTVDIIMDSAYDTKLVEVHHNLFEGGKQTLLEAVELLIRLSRKIRNEPVVNIVNLNLVVGYKVGVLSKDKGFRAATQLLLLLSRVPELIPQGIIVNIYEAGNVQVGAYSLSDFPEKLLFKSLDLASPQVVQKHYEKQVKKKEKKLQRPLFLGEMNLLRKEALDLRREKNDLTIKKFKNTFEFIHEEILSSHY